MKRKILLSTIAILSTTFLFSCNSETKQEITYDEASTLYTSLMEKANDTFKTITTMTIDCNMAVKNQSINLHIDLDKTPGSLYYYNKKNITISTDNYKQSSVIEGLITKGDNETTYKCYTKTGTILTTDTYTEESLSTLINNAIDECRSLYTTSDFPNKEGVSKDMKFYNYNNGGLMFESITEESSNTIKYDTNGMLFYACYKSDSNSLEYKSTYNSKFTKKSELTI